MKQILLLISISFFLKFEIPRFGDPKTVPKNIHCTINKSLAIKKVQDPDSDTLQIICDSVYKGKGYKITLVRFNSDDGDPEIYNSVFIFEKLINGKYRHIFSDSIYSRVQDVRFDGFNNDKVKDILVQNYSDARSNWTYYLYLVDIKRDKLKKIREFEEIKNPNYLPEYDLIDNYVMSGRIWTGFYKIINDRIKDFNIIIYDDQSDNGTYERDHKKAIKKILTKTRQPLK